MTLYVSNKFFFWGYFLFDLAAALLHTLSARSFIEYEILRLGAHNVIAYTFTTRRSRGNKRVDISRDRYRGMFFRSSYLSTDLVRR